MNFKQNKAFIQQWLLLLGGTIAWYLWQSIHVRNIWFNVMGVAGAIVLLLFLLVSFVKPKKDFVFRFPLKSKLLNAIWILLIVIASVLFFNLSFFVFSFGAGRMALAVGMAGLGALLMKASGSERSVYANFAVFLLLFGVLHRSFAFLNEIQPTAFSLGWSEGSRYYNASLFASKQVYGQQLPLPVLHPSRYLMQALPFYFGIRSILAHRIWQVLLWLGMTLWPAVLLAKRVKDGLKMHMLWLTLFFFLFFFQGAIYYHMMICVLLVLCGYHKDKPWRTLIFVVLSSIWAGISRVNWMPLPALMAVMLYLIEMPFDDKPWLKYLQFPVLWTIAGVGVAWLSKKAYVHFSGEPAYVFDSAFSSALLWERLLPNKTFFLGILPGVLLLCLPLFVLVLHKMRGKWAEVQYLRWLGIIGILLAFLAGGLLVSVKIGGGGDLHNLDAFIMLWAIACAFILAGKLKPDRESTEGVQSIALATEWKARPLWLAIAVIVPVFFAFMRAGTWQFKAEESHEADLAALKTSLQTYQDQEGPILFISERQLLTFAELEAIDIVHDYEKVFLMEMAMGDNQPYLQGFYEKLENHEFLAIVTDPISTTLQDSTRPFNEENNAWVTQVVVPILEHYRLEQAFRAGEVNLLVPISAD